MSKEIKENLESTRNSSQVNEFVSLVLCVICTVEIDQNIWPKYIYDPVGEEPLCKKCWQTEKERHEEEDKLYKKYAG